MVVQTAKALSTHSFKSYAGVAELVDAPDLGSGSERSGGSSPSTRTNFKSLLESIQEAFFMGDSFSGAPICNIPPVHPLFFSFYPHFL